MGDPIMLNPNSYATVQAVLESIQTGMETSREWTVAGCDGLPYVLAQRLRDKEDKLRDILILPGPGHFEMNMVRALMKLLWPLGMKELATTVMGQEMR